MLLQQMMPIIMPIPYNSGPSAPLTEQDVKIFLGIWIFLNLLWLISWCLSILKVVVQKKEWKDIRGWDDLSLTMLFDISMGICWGVGFAIYFGVLIANNFL